MNTTAKTCPCCGQPTLDPNRIYDICPVCGWEDDPIQAKYPDFWGGANNICLRIARESFKAGIPPALLDHKAHARYQTRVEKARKEALERGETLGEDDIPDFDVDDNEELAAEEADLHNAIQNNQKNYSGL